MLLMIDDDVSAAPSPTCGYLSKRSMWGYHKFWFVLDGETLTWWGDAKDVGEAPKDADHRILISRIAEVKASVVELELTVADEKRPDKKERLNLRAAYAEEVTLWATALEQARGRAASVRTSTSRHWLDALNACAAPGCLRPKVGARGLCTPHCKLLLGEAEAAAGPHWTGRRKELTLLCCPRGVGKLGLELGETCGEVFGVSSGALADKAGVRVGDMLAGVTARHPDPKAPESKRRYVVNMFHRK